ncbi:GNAT family N-acetyltransferase [Amycolatopsis magusensis]|uniref:GNAT family N-acetyltransferase n=1 Tax=Amycolatopsis magusensis TaxID=882444 RepID=UPI0024A7B254|nr:GNAT family N-acetyltransferase [Amycolatopsis magusensis]MDI5981060.1 GNAT family N-acetyltransferase [Amycolatopsis magusensis]
MTDLVIRPLHAGEGSLFDTLDVPQLVGFGVFGRKFAEMWAKGEYRPEWTWVALRDGELVARAAWWGGPEDTEPVALDWFDFTDREAAVELLRAPGFDKAEYELALPADWRERPEVVAARQDRIDAAVAAGMRPLVDRFRYTWTLEDGLPERPGRLEYRPEPDDEVVHAAFLRIQEGTLDAHARRAIAQGGLKQAADEEMEFMNWLPSPREWWRLAYTPEGDLVGVTVPGRNYGGAVVGIIGVVPEHRGHGYGYDLLVECTHLLVEAGETRVMAATDVGNKAMAAAFERAGYPVTQERAVLEWPA